MSTSAVEPAPDDDLEAKKRRLWDDFHRLCREFFTGAKDTTEKLVALAKVAADLRALGEVVVLPVEFKGRIRYLAEGKLAPEVAFLFLNRRDLVRVFAHIPDVEQQRRLATEELIDVRIGPGEKDYVKKRVSELSPPLVAQVFEIKSAPGGQKVCERRNLEQQLHYLNRRRRKQDVAALDDDAHIVLAQTTISRAMDRALRRRAKKRGVSLEQIIFDAIKRFLDSAA